MVRKSKKFLSVLLSVIMLLSVMPVTEVFAEDNTWVPEKGGTYYGEAVAASCEAFIFNRGEHREEYYIYHEGIDEWHGFRIMVVDAEILTRMLYEYNWDEYTYTDEYGNKITERCNEQTRVYSCPNSPTSLSLRFNTDDGVLGTCQNEECVENRLRFFNDSEISIITHAHYDDKYVIGDVVDFHESVEMRVPLSGGFTAELDSIKVVGQHFFENTSVKEVKFGQLLTEIEPYAFAGCNMLTDVYFPGTVEEWENVQIGEGNECLTNATLHAYGQWQSDAPATCLGGVEYRICICGDENCMTKETRPVAPDKSNHVGGTATRGAYEPTCQHGGYTGDVYCTSCNDTLERGEYIEKLPHNYGEWETVRQPSCSDGGQERRECVDCGAEDTRYVDVLPHTYGEWQVRVEPGCTHFGEEYRECVDCGAEDMRCTDMTPHTFGEWTSDWEATCVSMGRDYRVCSGCYLHEYRDVDMIPHTFKWTVETEPSCTHKGYKYGVCAYCGKREEVEDDRLDHVDTDADGLCDMCGGHIYDFSDNKCGDNLTWTLDSEGTLTISGTGDMWNFDIMFPWYDSDLMSDNLIFYEDLTKIKKVIIEDGVTSIGTCAFAYSFALKQVILPDSLKRIGGWAFEFCMTLEDIDLPSELEYIDDEAFVYCLLLEDIVIPSKVTYIGADAYGGVPADSITVEAPNAEIDQYAFGYHEGFVLKSGVDKKEFAEQYAELSLYFDFGKPFPEDEEARQEFYDNYEKLMGMLDEYTSEYSETLVLTGYKNSTTEVYALEHDIKFNALDGEVHIHTLVHVVEFPTCVYGGFEYNICSSCHATFNFISLPKTEHPFGDWVVTKEATHLSAGEKQRTCTYCKLVETEAIEKLPGNIAVDESTGVAVVYGDDSYSSEIQISVSSIYDEASFDIISFEKPEAQVKLFDITTLVDDVAEQPMEPVLVMIPLPEGFNPETTVIVYVTDQGTEVLSSFIENGYICFYASHFSKYAIVDEGFTEPEKPNCSCNCHKSGFKKVLWKIINFLHKILEHEKYHFCTCGDPHW